MSEEDDAQLGESIAAFGIKEALSICLELPDHLKPKIMEEDLPRIELPIPGAHWWVINGRNRTRHALGVGLETVPCNVYLGTLESGTVDNLITTWLQGKPSTKDVRRVIAHLEADKGMDAVQIRQATRFSQAYVENLMWCNRAIPPVQDALDEGYIAIGHAVLIARVEDEDFQERLLAIQLDNHLSIDALRQVAKGAREIMDGQLAPAPQPPLPLPRVVTCHYCRDEFPADSVVAALVCPTCEAKAWSSTRPPKSARRGRGGP